MKVLLVHQNFPGQFLHLAPALAARGHQVLALTAEANRRPSPVPVVRYRFADPAAPSQGGAPQSPAPQRLARHYEAAATRGLAVARAARQLRAERGFVPDVILGHPGWGETLFLKEVWPEARLIVYAEMMYRTGGLDTGFDPEFARPEFERRIGTVLRQPHHLQSLIQADAALSPTRFQAETFPPELRAKIAVCHDGIDTDRILPDPEARFDVPQGPGLRAGDEVLTYVSRSLEPYRGYHSFLRALPAVLAARPRAQVLIVGAEGQSYGPAPAAGSWKQIFWDEVRGRLDPSRVHFLGRVPPADYLRVLQVSRAHCYLTYPFVLSWSLLEAMAAGAMVIASDTAPLHEVIRDGENGRLVDFFDHAAIAGRLIAALAKPDAHLAMRAQARADVIRRYDLRRICLPRLVSLVETGT